LFDKKV